MHGRQPFVGDLLVLGRDAQFQCGHLFGLLGRDHGEAHTPFQRGALTFAKLRPFWKPPSRRGSGSRGFAGAARQVAAGAGSDGSEPANLGPLEGRCDEVSRDILATTAVEAVVA